MAPREELPWLIKSAIVQRLACYETPTQVAKAVKAEFDRDLSIQRISFYDATTRAGRALAPELKTLFAETRQRFLAEVNAIPIANAAVRLAALDRARVLAEARGQIPMVIALCEAAAKELGGAFTNRHQHEHTGKDGGPIAMLLREIDGQGRALPEPKKEA